MRDIAKAILVSDDLSRHSAPSTAGRIHPRTPADLLRALSAVRVFAGAPGARDLSVSGAEPLAYLAPPPGHEVTLEGYVTGRTQDGEYGLGIAFGIAPTPSPTEAEGTVACVIQNALRPAAIAAGGTGRSVYAQLLDEVIATQQRVTVTGLLRLLPDQASAWSPTLPRLLEVHPVRSVATERGLAFPQVPLDAPGGAEWNEIENVHPMPFADVQPRTKMAVTGAVLTFRDVPPIETAYVYMTGRFHGGRSRFVEGRPFLFAFGDAGGRTRITAATIPGTPAYEVSRRWLSTPPTGPITVVGLRTLYLPALFAPGGGRIEVLLCPVFRIYPGTVRGSSAPAPTAQYELVPIGGALHDGEGGSNGRGRPTKAFIRKRARAPVAGARARKSAARKRQSTPARRTAKGRRKR